MKKDRCLSRAAISRRVRALGRGQVGHHGGNCLIVHAVGRVGLEQYKRVDLKELTPLDVVLQLGRAKTATFVTFCV